MYWNYKVFLRTVCVTLVISSTGVSSTLTSTYIPKRLSERTQKITQIAKQSENLSPKKMKLIQKKMAKSAELFSKVSATKRTIRFSKFVMSVMKNDIQDERSRSRIMYQVSNWMLTEFDYRVYKPDWENLADTNKKLKKASSSNYSNYRRRSLNLQSQKIINGLLIDLDHYTRRLARSK